MSSNYWIGCLAYTPELDLTYGYIPSLAAGIVLCVLFGLSMLVHIGQAVYYKSWWTLVFAVGALTEVLGWAARAWSHSCPYNLNAFLMQITTLIIAPTFFTAGIYVILGRIIQILGNSHLTPSSSSSSTPKKMSPLSPAAYLWIFCTVDIISLVVQAAGGGLAAVAFQSTPPGDTKPGTHTMVAGIDFQLAAVVIFSLLFACVIYRATFLLQMHVFRTNIQMKLLVLATGFAILLIVMRSIYRTIELAGGWSGHVIRTERYFIALDGALMAAAVITFNVLHPGALLNGIKSSSEAQGEGTRHVDEHSQVEEPEAVQYDDDKPIQSSSPA